MKNIVETITIDFEPCAEVDYLTRLKQLQTSAGGKFFGHKANHIVLCDGDYLVDLPSLIKYARTYNNDDVIKANTMIFSRMAKEETAKFLNYSGRQYVFLDFIDGSVKKTKNAPDYGKIIIELFNDLCPSAAENFYLLCTGTKTNSTEQPRFYYEGSAIHRLVTDGWMQCGDIKDSTGANSVPAGAQVGQFIGDESFAADFGYQLGGIVGYANNGPHTNGSQFFVTLGPCGWMNTRYVGVGRVIFGFNVLQRINAAPTVCQRPAPEIVVGACGPEL